MVTHHGYEYTWGPKMATHYSYPYPHHGYRLLLGTSYGKKYLGVTHADHYLWVIINAPGIVWGCDPGPGLIWTMALGHRLCFLTHHCTIPN